MTKEAEKQWTLYVLKLEQDKWFVGITSGSPTVQLSRHKSGAGSEWTHHYAPIALSYHKQMGALSEDEALKVEGKLLRKYMEHYGDNNVRGGDIPVSEPKTTKKNKRGFGWSKVVWIAAVTLLSLIIVYLLLDKFIFTPTAQTIIIQ